MMKKHWIYGLLALLSSICMLCLLWLRSFLVIKEFYPYIGSTSLSCIQVLSNINVDDSVVIMTIVICALSLINFFIPSKVFAIINLCLTGIVTTLAVIAYITYLNMCTFNHFGFAGILYILELLSNIVLNIILCAYDSIDNSKGTYDFSNNMKE